MTTNVMSILLPPRSRGQGFQKRADLPSVDGQGNNGECVL